METDKKLIQQGDVLFFKQIDGAELPTEAKPAAKDHRGTVFAEGEATGHYHGTTDQAVTLFEMPNKQLWAKVTGDHPVSVTHQEHGAVILDPGLYRVGIVQEIDPFSKEIQNVKD